jgi:hypothetical protein
MAEDDFDYDGAEFDEEEEEEEDIGGLARAKKIIDKRIGTATRKGYNSHIKKLVKWLKINHPVQVITIDDVERPQVPIPHAILIQFLGDAPRLDRNGRLKHSSANPVANSTMNGIASAINDLYREAKIEMDQMTRIEVSSLMRGYRRTIADEKLAGRMKVFEGKRPITFRGYAMLAKYALQSQKKDSLFAHLYVVLCWNLFSRSNSIANIMYNHIEWKEDALMITVPKHKGDQEGAKAFPKHCYADPYTPEICPVLALALHIFCTSFRPDVTDPKLFSGSSLEGKFSNWLTQALKSDGLRDNADLGALADELGSHSFRYVQKLCIWDYANYRFYRKGVVTWVLSFPGGPSSVAAFLRACWSLGAVQSRYIFEGEGSDQYLGRVAAGLPLDCIDFCVLPPRFHPGYLATLTKEMWQGFIPHLHIFPQGLIEALPFLCASLAYHSPWLAATLSPSHPLFRTYIWTSGFLSAAREHVLVGNNRCNLTNMRASGIPPFMTLARQVYDIGQNMMELCQIVETNARNMMDRFTEVVSALPQSLGDYILRNCEVGGAVPVTADHVTRMFLEMRESLTDQIRASIAAAVTIPQPALAPQPAQAMEVDPNDPFSVELDGTVWKTFCWGGKLHPIPEDFTLPTMNTKALWDLWFFGDQASGIRPYKWFRKSDFVKSSDQTKLTKARSMIAQVIKYAVEQGGLQNESVNITSMSVHGAGNIFMIGFNSLVQGLEQKNQTKLGPARRYGEMAYTTVYKVFNN